MHETFKTKKHPKCSIQNQVTFLLLRGYTLNGIDLPFPIKASQWKMCKGCWFIYNYQTLPQMTCHPYQSLHIELLYLLPTGSPLYLGNITMNLPSVTAQNLTPKDSFLSPLCPKHAELHHTIYPIQSGFCAHCTPEGYSAISRPCSRANFYKAHM